MDDNINRKKPNYLLLLAVVVCVVGTYMSYVEVGLTTSLIPAIISLLGIACLLAELASGNFAIVSLREWNRIEIGVFGKLALLLGLVGGLATIV